MRARTVTDYNILQSLNNILKSFCVVCAQESEVFTGHETAEIRPGIVQGHHAGPGRFEIVAGRAAQTAVGRAGHVDDDGEGRELEKRLRLYTR